jgi:cell wall-associated NlpC family hydrolase
MPLYRDQRGNVVPRSPVHALTAAEWIEIDKIHNELVFPLLRFVLPRLLPEPLLPADASAGQRIAARAYRYLGVRYRQTVIPYNPKIDPPTLDCIDLVRWVLHSLRLPFKFRRPPEGVPWTGVESCFRSENFRHLKEPPSHASLQPGDLLLRRNAKKEWVHISIFVGEGYLIEAPYAGTVVQRNDLDLGRWNLAIRYQGA